MSNSVKSLPYNFRCRVCAKTFRIKTPAARVYVETYGACRRCSRRQTFVPHNRLPSFIVDDDWSSNRRTGPAKITPVRFSLLCLITWIVSNPLLGWLMLKAMDKPTTSHDMLMGILVVNLIAVAALMYFLPTIIAVYRKHANAVPLAIINAVFGWTAIGYVGCLAWSCAAKGTS